LDSFGDALAVIADKPRRKVIFQRQCLHDVNRRNGLGSSGRQGAFAFSLLAGGLVNAPAKSHRGKSEQRQHQHGQQRQTPVNDQHHKEHAEKHKRTCHQWHERRNRDIAQHFDVAGDARQQIPSAGLGMKRKR
jgi:hypothetical protein